MFSDINNEIEYVKKLNSNRGKYLRNPNLKNFNQLQSKFGINNFAKQSNQQSTQTIPISSNFKFSQLSVNDLSNAQYQNNNNNNLSEGNNFLNSNNSGNENNNNSNAYRSNINLSRTIPHEKYANNVGFTNNLTNHNDNTALSQEVSVSNSQNNALDGIKKIEENIEKMGKQISLLQDRLNGNDQRYENQNKQIIDLQENLKKGFNKLDIVLDKLQLSMNSNK